MKLEQLEELIIDWSKENISHEFSKEQLVTDIALFGINSINVVELCEHLSDNLTIDVDEDIFIESNTFREACLVLHSRLQLQSS
jgi:hypothetical protein